MLTAHLIVDWLGEAVLEILGRIREILYLYVQRFFFSHYQQMVDSQPFQLKKRFLNSVSELDAC